VAGYGVVGDAELNAGVRCGGEKVEEVVVDGKQVAAVLEGVFEAAVGDLRKLAGEICGLGGYEGVGGVGGGAPVCTAGMDAGRS
jgi:hypothetical protein